MFPRQTRRRFLQAAVAAGAGLSSHRSFVSLARAGEEHEPVRFGPDLEPIVRLIEETPRDECVAALAGQLRAGLPDRRLLAGVFFAALRKQNSHHSVFLIHSAHQLSRDLPQRHRLLPLFWAVDHFKWQQARFPTPPLARLTGSLPEPARAEIELRDALQRGDMQQAECAAVALARSLGARQAFDALWQYGCRDVSLIGHRAIAVTSCWRTLESLGWQHAEPVLRFVLQNLMTTNGGPDRYHQSNLARVDEVVDRLPAGWVVGRADRGVTAEGIALLRAGRDQPACEWAVKRLRAGFGAQPIWDALHVAAAELLIRHPDETGIAARPLHACTTLNALHFAFDTTFVPRVRLLILLQATAWVCDFIRSHLTDAQSHDGSELDGDPAPASASDAVDDIFDQLPPRTYDLSSQTKGGYRLINREARRDHGRKVFALIKQIPSAAAHYMQTARQWMCEKAAIEAHELKLPIALFEDYELVSPEWRPRLLAASAHWLHGRQSPDSEFLRQVREALQTL